MRLHISQLIVAATACSTIGCAPELRSGESRASETPIAVGADSDAHGCKASAGYVWCAGEGACVRPWELAKQKGFDLEKDGLDRYCVADER